MSSIEIANLEHASRAAMAWEPEGADGSNRTGDLLRAAVPVIGVLAAVAVLLFAML